MLKKGELSEAAQECVEADDQIEEALKEEEKALGLMNSVFQRHFSGLITTLSTHKIEDSEDYRGKVKDQLEQMKKDCLVFQRLQHYKELTRIASEMYGHIDKLIGQLYNFDLAHVKTSEDLLRFLQREEGPLSKYYGLISKDLREFLLQDEQIENIIKKRQVSG
jgi:hypothetical protein